MLQTLSTHNILSSSSQLLAPVVNTIANRFPTVLPGIKARQQQYDEDSNGPHEHALNPNRTAELETTFGQFQPNSTGISWNTRLTGLPSVNCIQKRFFKSPASVAQNATDVFKTPDFSDYRRPNLNATSNRAFTYVMVGATGALAAMSAKSSIMNLLSTLSASGDVLAMAQVEVDLSNIPEGKSVVLKWRGKPIFIRHRTAEEIEIAESTPLSELRDPQPDQDRVQKPEWLVMLGVCTHLGCVPLSDSGDYNGWYCPCHGSHYDISGRIRKGPAPLNLEVPKYKFTAEEHIVIG